MSVVKSFSRARMVPNPAGSPELIFTRWSFGQMRPLHTIATNITLTNAFQTYLDIFIPANTWAQFKNMFIDFNVDVHSNLRGAPGITHYSEQYNLGATGQVARLAAQNVPAGPVITKYNIKRYFYSSAVDIIETNFNGAPNNGALSIVDGVNHSLIVNGLLTAFDRTIDNHLLLQMKTDFPASNDTLVFHTAQAFIQAPYDLRRLVS